MKFCCLGTPGMPNDSSLIAYFESIVLFSNCPTQHKQPMEPLLVSECPLPSQFFHEVTSLDTKITKSYHFQKLDLSVGMIISIICIFAFVAFLGHSAYSNDEEAFVRNTPCKIFHQ